MNLFISILGWIGVVLVFVTYWLLVSKRLASASPAYHWLNLVGAVLLVVNFLWNHAYPGAGLNAGWALIALYGLWGTWKGGLPKPYRLLDRKSERQRYRSRKAAGLCVRCGLPAVEIHFKNGKKKHSVYCAAHAARNRAKVRTYLQAKPVEVRRALWRKRARLWYSRHK